LRRKKKIHDLEEIETMQKGTSKKRVNTRMEKKEVITPRIVKSHGEGKSPKGEGVGQGERKKTILKKRNYRKENAGQQ